MNETGVDLVVDGNEIDLTWWFWESQLEALEALESGEHDIVVYRGGYGSGKSVLGARWLIKVALAVPNGRSLCLGQDFAKGQGTTFKVLFEQLPGEDTVDKDGEKGDPENSPIISGYNRNKKRLTFFNGHVIKLGAGDRWNREAGAEYNAIWADEVAHYENVDIYKLNEMLISRQRTKQGPNVSLWTSTGNGFNQFYDFVYRQVDKRENDLTTNIKNVVADSRNNPFLSEKNKLVRQFEGTAREDEALKGGFAAANDLVYHTFSREHNIIPHAEARRRVGAWRCYGYDHGWEHPRVLLEVGKTTYDQYVVLDMFYESNTTLEDAIEWLEHHRKGRIYCEHEPDHAYKLQRKGYRTVAANKSLNTGIPIVRDRFRPDENGKPGLLVSRQCDDLIQEIMSYKEEHVGKQDAPDDGCDALRYIIATEAERPDVGELPEYQPRLS